MKKILLILFLNFLIGCSSIGIKEPSPPTVSSPKGIAASFLRHLDVATTLDENERRQFLVRQPYGSLQHLNAGVYVSDKLGTASSTVFHFDPHGQLRHTQFTVGAQGGLVVDTSLVEDGDLVRSLVVFGIDEILREIPTGIEDEIGPCIESSLEAEEPIESLLDCLGLGGGGSSDPGFGKWLSEFRNPDCSNTPGPVSDDSSVDSWIEKTEEEFPDNIAVQQAAESATTALNSYRVVHASFIAAAGTPGADPLELIHLAEATQEAYAVLGDALRSLRNAHSFASGNIIRVSPFYSPIPGPDGESPGSANDPRCEGRNTDSARGTLFTNPDFCQDGDYLQCLAEEQDPIRRITNGKCRTTEGHAGGMMLACGDNIAWSLQDAKERAQAEASSNCGASADGTQSYCDFNVPFADTGNVGKEYIDTMDLGPVFDGLCAAGGCGIPFPD